MRKMTPWPWLLLLGASGMVGCGAETTTPNVASKGDGGAGGAGGAAGVAGVKAGGTSGTAAFTGGGGVSEAGGRTANGGLAGGSGGEIGSGGVAGGSGGDALGGGGYGGRGGRATAMDGGAADAGTGCAFTFAVTTVTASGRYAPRNVGAVWISAGDGTFVKTLKTWGTIELRSAIAWETASQGNTVDAVSGATRNLAGPLTASWNCTDTARQRVAPGRYNVNVTFAEDHPMQTPPPAIHEATIPFAIDAGPSTLIPPDQPYFRDMHLTVQ